MKKTLKTGAVCGVLLGGVFALLACGDDVTKVTNVTNETVGMEIAKSVYALGTCGSANIGKMAFAADRNTAYVCSDSGWTPLTKTADCALETLSDSSGHKIVCGGDSVGVLLSATDGTDGKNGKNGTGGKDGKNGTDGTNGQDGDSCSLTENGDGTVTQICGKDTVTLYKALCGKTPYEPEQSFCFENALYGLCKGNAYDPTCERCTDKGVVGEIADSRDGQVYSTVKIGSQVWMAENLNYAYPKESAASTDSLSFCYDNNPDNCNKYGRLYTWAAAMDSVKTGCGNGITCTASEPVRGVCPEGFHLPSKTDWTTLGEYIKDNSQNSVFDALKSTEGWSYANGKDEFGFGALAAGFYGASSKKFNALGEYAVFWSSKESASTTAVSFALMDVTIFGTTSTAKYLTDNKGSANSVRCVKD